MLILLSPAKTLDFEPLDKDLIQALKPQIKKPAALKHSQTLVNILKSKKSEDLQKLMKISEKIADLNVERFQKFDKNFKLSNAKPAGFAFKGDVYRGLQFSNFTPSQIQFAQKHLRILSGLYGFLKPLDLIQPYRLEMGTALKNEAGKNLYDFWDKKITQLINKDLKENQNEFILNLASKEYFSSIKTPLLDKPVINIAFKELRGDKYKIISFSAKVARGLMSQYIIKNKITHLNKLKKFNLEGYSFNKSLSTETNNIELVFTIPKPNL